MSKADIAAFLSSSELASLHAPAAFASHGLDFTLRSGFRTTSHASGVMFDVSDAGVAIGEASAILTADALGVDRCGHVGCELLGQSRGKDYPTAIGRALVELLLSRGISPIVLTCDEVNQSMIRCIESIGGSRLEGLPADGSHTAKARFRIGS
jgi:predicted acetyltransferase